jgi:3-hydroxyacyl-CoA dehydrogenase
MSELVRFTKQDDVAVITIDNPPVNALSPGVPEGITSSIERAKHDPSVRTIVVIGAGRTFVAGADIKEFAKIRSQGGRVNLLPALLTIEDCPKPVVMAIHGTALGGGLELAMAGHYRVASPDAQVGQPETKLGIIPGAGGTQRLPRLAGVTKAVEMCAFGEPVPAPEAKQFGLVDCIIEGDLLTGAVTFAREVASTPPPKTRERNEKIGPADFTAAREQARKTRRNLMAPLKAIDAVEAATKLPFEEGCQRERELFVECLLSNQSKGLIHAFFAERAASKIPDVPKDTPAYAIRKAAIVGAGTMGGGIAMVCANAGLPVLIKETDRAALDRGLATIRKNYENSVKRGRFSREMMDQRMARIHPQLTYDGFEGVDLVIEAAFENLAVKKQIFAEIDKIAKPDCVLASNTSTLDIDEIASATSRPQMVIGLHFFSPANVMRLLEVVRGKATGTEVIATAMALAKKLGKVGVLVGNCRGFVGNRMFFPYMREAQFLAEEGATPQQVDAALYEWGMAMGIFAVDDMAGIDVAWRAHQEHKHLHQPGARKPLVLDKLYEMGRYGQKTGAGWYRYDQNRKPVPDPGVEALIEKMAAEAGIRRRAIGADEIVERCLYIMINEGARILEEGYALRASDIDIVYLNGYGFPAYRGGPMFYADMVGLTKVYDRVREFHRQHGERWEPAPLLQRLAEQGKTFQEEITSEPAAG